MQEGGIYPKVSRFPWCSILSCFILWFFSFCVLFLCC